MKNTTLLQAMEIDSKKTNVITFVGAGGKSTLMGTLAEMLVDQSYPVVVTTTTKIYPPRHDNTLLLFPKELTNQERMQQIRIHLQKEKILYLGRKVEKGKLIGLAGPEIDQLKGCVPFLLVEGDGAAKKPLKAPAAHEPVIPQCTDLLCVVAGLDVLGKPLCHNHVHRLEEILRVTGRKEGDPVTPWVVAMVLSRPEGYFRTGMRTIAILNKADTLLRRSMAQEIVNILADDSKFDNVLLTALDRKPIFIDAVFNRKNTGLRG